MLDNAVVAILDRMKTFKTTSNTDTLNNEIKTISDTFNKEIAEYDLNAACKKIGTEEQCKCVESFVEKSTGFMRDIQLLPVIMSPVESDDQKRDYATVMAFLDDSLETALKVPFDTLTEVPKLTADQKWKELVATILAKSRDVLEERAGKRMGRGKARESVGKGKVLGKGKGKQGGSINRQCSGLRFAPTTSSPWGGLRHKQAVQQVKVEAAPTTSSPPPMPPLLRWRRLRRKEDPYY